MDDTPLLQVRNEPYHQLMASRLNRLDTLFLSDKVMWREFAMKIMVEFLAQIGDEKELSNLKEYERLSDQELEANLTIYRIKLGYRHDTSLNKSSIFDKVKSRWKD